MDNKIMKYLLPRISKVLAMCFVVMLCGKVQVQGEVPLVSDVEGQPLGANAKRLISALEYLGAALPETLSKSLKQAADNRDAEKVQQLLDQQVLFVVDLNPEVRVKVNRGPGKGKWR